MITKVSYVGSFQVEGRQCFHRRLQDYLLQGKIDINISVFLELASLGGYKDLWAILNQKIDLATDLKWN